MAEPQTNNIGLFVPNTGDQVGTWGALSINPNASVIDGFQAGLATIGAAASPITLTGPAGFTATPSAGPTQSQNAVIRFTGTLTANVAVTFPLPGYYIVENLCSGVDSFYIQLVAPGAGNKIGAIPGKKHHVYSDGTDFDYVSMRDPGEAYDLHGWTTYPPWMLACTIMPYLIKDGSNYLVSAFPNLYNSIGNAFGGTPTLNFNVPDELARARIGYDTTGTGRLTTAVSGVNGQTMGSAGGDQSQTLAQGNLPNVTFPNSLVLPANIIIQCAVAASSPTNGNGIPIASNKATGTGISIPAQAGQTLTGSVTSGGSGNPVTTVPPAIVSFLPLIKTAILIGAFAVSFLHLAA